MIHTLDNSTRESLKNELRNSFPHLSEAELDKIDESLEKLVSNVSTDYGNILAPDGLREKIEYVRSKVI